MRGTRIAFDGVAMGAKMAHLLPCARRELFASALPLDIRFGVATVAGVWSTSVSKSLD